MSRVDALSLIAGFRVSANRLLNPHYACRGGRGLAAVLQPTSAGDLRGPTVSHHAGVDDAKVGTDHRVKGECMGTPPKNIETRAEGRPPEEAGSDDPEEQAAAILEESEERLEEGSKTSVGTDET
jgi:hypothetical protein